MLEKLYDQKLTTVNVRISLSDCCKFQNITIGIIVNTKTAAPHWKKNTVKPREVASSKLNFCNYNIMCASHFYILYKTFRS